MNEKSSIKPQRSRTFVGLAERWPVECLPPEGEFVFVDRGQTWGHIGKSIPAVLTEGEWRGLNRKPLPWSPTHWSRLTGNPVNG